MYKEGTLVIFKCHDTTQVGMITEVDKKIKNKITYTIKSERGKDYIVVGVDDLKSVYTILSTMTDQNLKSKKITNNMYLDGTANLSETLTKREKELYQN